MGFQAQNVSFDVVSVTNNGMQSQGTEISSAMNTLMPATNGKNPIIVNEALTGLQPEGPATDFRSRFNAPKSPTPTGGKGR